jgi:hypothetical protein
MRPRRQERNLAAAATEADGDVGGRGQIGNCPVDIVDGQAEVVQALAMRFEVLGDRTVGAGR